MKVALILVGDELLSGRFADENGHLLIRALRERGITLSRLAVVSDHENEIADEVRFSLERADWVLTSGGIGPTHDDRTYAGVAQALGVELETLPELIGVLERYDVEKTRANLRMAQVPAGATLRYPEGSPLPVVVAGRVLILPGVPKLFAIALPGILPLFAGAPLFVESWETERRETDFADALATAALDFPRVKVGSYPRPGGVVLLIAEGESRDEVDLCVTALRPLTR